MQFQILGIQALNFTDKETGQVIDGVKLHLANKKASDFITGFAVSNQFIPSKKFQIKVNGTPLESLINRTIDFQFNQKGKVDDFDILPLK